MSWAYKKIRLFFSHSLFMTFLSTLHPTCMQSFILNLAVFENHSKKSHFTKSGAREAEGRLSERSVLKFFEMTVLGGIFILP